MQGVNTRRHRRKGVLSVGVIGVLISFSAVGIMRVPTLLVPLKAADPENGPGRADHQQRDQRPFPYLAQAVPFPNGGKIGERPARGLDPASGPASELRPDRVSGDRDDQRLHDPANQRTRQGADDVIEENGNDSGNRAERDDDQVPEPMEEERQKTPDRPPEDREPVDDPLKRHYQQMGNRRQPAYQNVPDRHQHAQKRLKDRKERDQDTVEHGYRQRREGRHDHSFPLSVIGILEGAARA